MNAHNPTLSRSRAILAGAPALERSFEDLCKLKPDILDRLPVVTLLAHLRVAGDASTWSEDLLTNTPAVISDDCVREQWALLDHIDLHEGQDPRKAWVSEPLLKLAKIAWRSVTGRSLGDPARMSLADPVARAFAEGLTRAVIHFNTHPPSSHRRRTT